VKLSVHARLVYLPLAIIVTASAAAGLSLESELRDLLLLAGLIGLGLAVVTVWIAYRLVPAASRTVSMTDHDSVSDSEAHSHQLGEERDRIEAVLEGMDEGVIGVGADMRVTLVNRGARDLFNLPEHTVGMAIQRLIPHAGFQQIIAQARQEGAVEAEIEVTSAPPKVVLVRATPQRSTEGIVIVLYDITRVRHLEQMRRDFVANVSHELRTPVSVVQLNAETLLEGALEDQSQARNFVQAILRNAQRLSRIIDELLDLSRIEAEKYEISKTQLALKGAVDRAINTVSTQLEKSEMRVDVEIDEDLQVLANENAVEQILTNLIDNATKYGPRKGVIRVRAHERLGSIRIEVIDDGPGIPREHQERLFERFYRVDAGRSRQMGGTGLGLAIVKHLAAAMGGRVGVESDPPNGALFWVALPVPTKTS
jgi:two-component system phosphate regulon sensor histidine kinase PhoR